MRLFGKANGTIDRHDRAEWLTPPFDGAYQAVVAPVVPPILHGGRYLFPAPRPQQRRELIELTIRPVFGQVLDCRWILSITPHAEPAVAPEPVQPLAVPSVVPKILPPVVLVAQFARAIEIHAEFAASLEVQGEFTLSLSVDAEF